MPIDQIFGGSRLRVTTCKQLTTNPNAKWVNTYEIKAGGILGQTVQNLASVAQMANVIVDWERQFALTTTLFERVVVSTWEADTTPYNGDEFLSIPISETGTRVQSNEALGLNSCLLVRRVPATGRNGRLLLRNYLMEGDVTATAGYSNLTSGALAALSSAMLPGNTTDLQQMLDDANEVDAWILSMFGINSQGGITDRRITALTPSDAVVFKKLDNRYFRRG